MPGFINYQLNYKTLFGQNNLCFPKWNKTTENVGKPQQCKVNKYKNKQNKPQPWNRCPEHHFERLDLSLVCCVLVYHSFPLICLLPICYHKQHRYVGITTNLFSTSFGLSTNLMKLEMLPILTSEALLRENKNNKF